MAPWKPLKNQSGIAFVIALLMLLVLTLIGVASVSLSSFETNIAGNERLYNLAFYAADGGVENFRGQINSGMFIYSPINTGSYQVTIGGAPCNVSYTRWPGSGVGAGGPSSNFKVTVEGQAPFPAQGKVVVEAIVEASMMKPEGYN
jgi:Tfp pilus assembly protein PilX